MITFDQIEAASRRIAPYINTTPIVESQRLNEWLGHRILFKAECLQKTGAFKIRGATNFLTTLAEKGELPKHIVANSSGNHAQAVAYAAAIFEIPVTIFSTENISEVKAAATEYYGAELRLYPDRMQADEAVAEAAKQPGVLWIPPFDHPYIIAGQGTAAIEALEQTGPVDAVFAPCGGGGLLSGTLLATRHLYPDAEVIGAEPLAANDAAQSLQAGSIQRLQGTPDTLADGAATPSVGEHTFPIIQQVDDFYEVDETQIAYWTQWLQHLLKLHIEPTCCMTMAAVAAWLQSQPEQKTVLVMLSGGNIDQAKMQKLWQTDYLQQMPLLG